MESIGSVLASVVALTFACRNAAPSGSELLEAKRAEMAAYVAPIRKAVVANPPLLTADGVKDVEGPLISWLEPNGNTVVLSESRVHEMRADGDWTSSDETHDAVDMGQFNLFGTIRFAAMTDWLVGKPLPNFHPSTYRDKPAAQRLIDHFLALRYVIVVRFLEYVEPSFRVDPRANVEATPDTDKIVPGRLSAEARILDMGGGDHGGFRYEVTFSADFTLDARRRLSSMAADLEDLNEQAFDTALQRLLPGSSRLSRFIWVED